MARRNAADDTAPITDGAADEITVEPDAATGELDDTPVAETEVEEPAEAPADEAVPVADQYVVDEDFQATVDWTTVSFKAGARLDAVAGAKLAASGAPVSPLKD
jgi:hypothetical protein